MRLNHALRSWIFESLIHSNFSSSWSLFLTTHVHSLEVTVHRSSTWLKLLESITLLLWNLDIHVLFLSKVALFTRISSTCWRFIHSCSKSLLRHMIICRSCNVLTTHLISMIDFVRATNWVVIWSIHKLRFRGSYTKVVDRVWIFLVYIHNLLIYRILSNGSTIETTTVAIFLSLFFCLNSLNAQ